MAGVTPQGFVRLRLPEIRSAIFNDLRQRLRDAGLPDDIDTRADTITGLMVGTFAEREAALWELAEGVYYSMYPNSAEGVQLDRSVSFTGVERRQAEYSKAVVVAFGNAGATIPSGAQVRDSITQAIWVTTDDVTITTAAAKVVEVTPTVADSTTYTITVDGADYSYTSDSSANLQEILTGLTNQFSATDYTATEDGASVRIVTDAAMAMSVSISANLAITTLGSAVTARSQRREPIEADAGDIDTIITNVAGWDSVTNLERASPGRATETDAQLRARYDEGVFALGAATYPSIKPNLQAAVSGLDAVTVIENDTDSIDAAGNKPHSIHVIAAGGLDSELAEAIHDVKAAGIDTNGATTVNVMDDSGLHPIRFSRPAPVYIWIKITVTKQDASEPETFPADGFVRIENDVLALAEMFGIGYDVIREHFYSAIYKTPGIAMAKVELASKTNPSDTPAPGDYAETNIAISNLQNSVFRKTSVIVQ